MQLYRWDFDSPTVDGWFHDAARDRSLPAVAMGGEMVIGQESLSVPHYTRLLDHPGARRANGLTAQCSIRGEVHAIDPAAALSVALRVERDTATYEEVRLPFAASFGPTTLITVPLMLDEGYPVAVIGVDNDGLGAADFTLYVDWFQVLDESGAIIITDAPPPKPPGSEEKVTIGM